LPIDDTADYQSALQHWQAALSLSAFLDLVKPCTLEQVLGEPLSNSRSLAFIRG